mmetsp:Transcript_22671/g.43328  ORF Transcript_22671/g.43328 Transcript_22671/m.43328 type:complete len:281 (+) Transcript_22671:129-971(+)|eukprot:CAMPEP_0114252120 /NCGR_PEP_ID=MMETSP0058-20121206/15661_1 /TAXON_ID=36894 /ORGANISM="Pyramimonas parkeae, CCMP726" /LENGTH=280 /DNA_ID=CAMNT_0001366021 /DNA_START=59 /DNA_END=901 /DNA_ORIENTATION=-
MAIEPDAANVDIKPMTSEEEDLLKDFFKDVNEAARMGEVDRILSCFKLNPYEHLNLRFEATLEEVKKQYRKVSLLVHPDKNPHPRAKDAFAALGKAVEWLQDEARVKGLQGSLNHAREMVRKERKKEVKADAALSAQIRLMAANGILPDYEASDDFHSRWKSKARQVLTDIEWRRRKITLRITDEEERVKEVEKEDKKIRNAEKRERQEWEGRREERVGSWRDFTGKKKKVSGEIKPPKLKEEDGDRSYVQRRVQSSGTVAGAHMGGKVGAKNTFKRGFN